MFDIEYFFKESSFQGVIILIDHNLKITRVNERFLSLQGYSQKELIGKSIIDIVTPSDKTVFFDMAYTNEISKEFSCQMYHRSGAFRHFSFTMFRFKDYNLFLGKAEKKEFFSYKYDNISDVVVNTVLEESDSLDIKDLFAENSATGLILNIFPSDIWIKDRLGKYVFINRAFTNHTGYKPNQVVGKDDFEVFPKGVALEFAKSDQIAIKSKKKIDYSFENTDENFITWAEVSKIPLFNKNGLYIGIVGYSNDISEFKSIEFNLKNTIQKYHVVASLFFDLAFEISVDGVISSVYGKMIDENNLAEMQDLLSNVFSMNSKDGFDEKIKVAVNGVITKTIKTIKNISIEFTLIPFKYDDKMVIVCVGSKIANG